VAAMFSMSNVGPCQTSWQGTNYPTVVVNHNSVIVYKIVNARRGACAERKTTRIRSSRKRHGGRSLQNSNRGSGTDSQQLTPYFPGSL